MSSNIFAVLRTRGPSWNDAAAMEQQVDWRGHADFMNQLVSEGVILLGGPLTGTRDVLLIVRAGNRRRSTRGLQLIAGQSTGFCAPRK